MGRDHHVLTHTSPTKTELRASWSRRSRNRKKKNIQRDGMSAYLQKNADRSRQLNSVKGYAYGGWRTSTIILWRSE